MAENEIWVPVIIWKNGIKYDFTGLYEVSNFGILKALGKRDRAGKIRKEKIMHPGVSKDPHNAYERTVLVTQNGKRISVTMGRLVWESFNGQIPEGMQINHLDENKINNCLDNLSPTTPKENNNWGTRIERAAKTNSIVLKNRPDCSKRIFQFDIDNNFIREWSSTMEIERTLGFIHNAISLCCKGKTKSSYGFKWQYAE